MKRSFIVEDVLLVIHSGCRSCKTAFSGLPCLRGRMSSIELLDTSLQFILVFTKFPGFCLSFFCNVFCPVCTRFPLREHESVKSSLVWFCWTHGSVCRMFITLLSLCLIFRRYLEFLDLVDLRSFFEGLIAKCLFLLSAWVWVLQPLFPWGRAPLFCVELLPALR